MIGHGTQVLVALGLTLAAAPALASGAGGAGAHAPAIDASALPEGAVVRPPAVGDQRHPVEVRLLAEQATVAPGGTLSLGVQMIQDPEWHTYWVVPGDIGLPTDVTLTLPEGVAGGATVRDRTWVLPEQFVQDVITSYGYSDQVLHELDVVLPDDVPAGPLTVSAHVSWLVCKSSCIPGEADVTTTVQVADAATDGPHKPLFDYYRGHWPVRAEDVAGLDVQVVQCTDPVVPDGQLQVVVAVHPKQGHTLAFTTPEGMWPTAAAVAGSNVFLDTRRIVPDDDGFLVAVGGSAFADELPEHDVAGALLQVDVDGSTVHALALAEMNWADKGTIVAASSDPACRAFTAPVAAAAPIDVGDPGPPEGPGNPVGPAAWSITLLLSNLGLAFVGGLILNVMPCVLPVLMLKLYGLVEQGGISDGEKRQAGMMYTAGILVSFLALALGVWVLRSVLGQDVVWGYQMQYPGYVAGLASLVFLFGLSLFGVFEIPAFGTGSAHELSSKEGPAGYFFTGVFATLVATPCSAPILGAATAFAFAAPTYLLVLIFLMVGLGLASPFLVVAFVPAVYRFLPAPGAWMESFKQFLGFTLMLTTVWLVSVLFGLVGTDGGISFLVFLTAVSMGAWIFGHWGGVAADPGDQLKSLAVGLGVVVLAGWRFLDLELAPPDTCVDGSPVQVDVAYDDHIPWQAFSPERVEELRGHVVFLDFTADWCVSCKVNERTVLETATVREALGRYEVVALQGDFTRKDPAIQAWLTRFRRAGVPMYVVIPPTGLQDAILLPEVITPGMVVEAVEQAAGQTVGRR
ncbi:MAG: thioredoxin family protein [Alphaproteobacteria bacterium]|nr:thioredoxin family protein [Alphaproteobacteria bacterium]